MSEEMTAAQQRAESMKRQYLALCPARFHGAKMETVTDDQHRGEIQHWIAPQSVPVQHQPQTLLLVGGVGTGKTHAAWAALRRCAGLGLQIGGATVPDLLESMRPDGPPLAEVDAARSADVYLLDDLGTERATEWALEQIGGILDARTRSMQRTIVTTNATPEQMLEQYGARTWSRLRSGAKVLVYAGNDQRAVHW